MTFHWSDPGVLHLVWMGVDKSEDAQLHTCSRVWLLSFVGQTSDGLRACLARGRIVCRISLDVGRERERRGWSLV